MSRDTHTYQEEINTAFKSIKDFIRYDIQLYSNMEKMYRNMGIEEEAETNGNFQIWVEFNGTRIHFGETYYYIDTPDDIEELKNKIIEYYNYLDTGDIMGKYSILYTNDSNCYTAQEL